MRLFILYNLQLEIINFLYENLRKEVLAEMTKIFMVKTASIAFISFLLLTSFNLNNKCLQIQFKNSTGKDFIELKVWTIDGDIILHNLKNGKVSQAFSITKSYKFTYANAVTKSGIFTTPGHCITGETVYSGGEMIMEFILTPESYKNSAKANPYLYIKTTIDEGVIENSDAISAN